MNPVRMMKIHPAAALFPLLEGDDLRALVEDIRVYGVRQPAVTYKGELLDGRNRIRACDLLGINPPSVEYEGADPVGFVISANLRRRHMDDGQRALVAAKLATLAQGARTDLSPIGEKSQAEAARLLNVSKRSVERAGVVLDNGAPELVAAVENGEASVSAAAVVASLPVADQVDAVRAGTVAAVAKQIRRPAVIDGEARHEPDAGAAGEGGEPPPPQPAVDRATAPPPAQPTQASRALPDATALGGSDLLRVARMCLMEIQKRAPRARKKAFSAIDGELNDLGRTKVFRSESGTDLTATFGGYDERAAEMDNLRGAVEALNQRNTELENENTGLREAIALAKLPADEALTAKAMIDELRAEVEALRKELNTATATLKATTISRDELLSENAQVRRQCAAQQRKIKKLSGGGHGAA